MEKKFNSPTEEGKVLVREFMSTVEGSVERKEIINYIRGHITDKGTLTTGIEAGIIKIMSANGELVSTGHGLYKYSDKQETLSLQDRILKMFETFQADIDKACTVNLLKVSEEDRKFIEKIGEISNQLMESIWLLEDMIPTKPADEIKPTEETPVITEETKPEEESKNKKK